jgi:hypothetical protein
VPLPKARIHVSFDYTLTNQDLQALATGRVPQSSDDKWFWFMERDRLFVHRASSGECFFEIEFSNVGDHYRVSDVAANGEVFAADPAGAQEWATGLLDSILGRPHTRVDRINAALRRQLSAFSPSLIEDVQTGRVTGAIVSADFRGLSPSEREKRVRSILQTELDSDDLGRVGHLVAMTPEEDPLYFAIPQPPIEQ